MEFKLLVAAFCLASFRVSDAVVPVISTGNIKTANVDEDVAASSTVFTLTSDQAALYTLTGTDSAAFTAAPTTGTLSTTGTITINAIPDFQTSASYSFNVLVTNAGTEVTTVVVTLTVINKSPAFPTTGYGACLSDNTAAGTTVATVSGTPAVAANTALTYTFSSGNTGDVFALLAPTTGVITIAAGKTVAAATQTGYALVINAKDTASPIQTGTTTVFVFVGALCSGAEIITGSVAAILSMLFCFIQKLA